MVFEAAGTCFQAFGPAETCRQAFSKCCSKQLFEALFLALEARQWCLFLDALGTVSGSFFVYLNLPGRAAETCHTAVLKRCRRSSCPGSRYHCRVPPMLEAKPQKAGALFLQRFARFSRPKCLRPVPAASGTMHCIATLPMPDGF